MRITRTSEPNYVRTKSHYLRTDREYPLWTTLLRIAKVASGYRGNEGKMPSPARIRLAMAERPDWQPISRLPLIGSMIDAMLQDAEEHYQTLLQASPKPHVLDDYIVGRVFEVFGSQKDDRKGPR